MAINKLNLNGTVYDIGEAEGTNTAESIVEFDSNDELDPSAADESVELIKSGDTHKSLWEKISAGMKNIRYLLKQITSLNSALADINTGKQNSLVVDSVTVDNLTIESGSYLVQTANVSKSGYTALGLLGYMINNASSSGSGCSRAFVYECRLTDSTTARIAMRNSYTNGDIKVLVTFYVLYAAN